MKNLKYFTNIEKANQLINILFYCINAEASCPPNGKIKHTQLRYQYQKHKIVMWDVMSGDYSEIINGEKSGGNVLKWSRPGSIIVFNDTQQAFKNLKVALPQILDRFRKKGLNFGIINHI